MPCYGALAGLATVATLVIALAVCVPGTPGFDLLHDHLSLLGARGQAYAGCWNLVGFCAPGLGMSLFGWLLGRVLQDRLAGACLVVSGVGYALGAVPAEQASPMTDLSKVHFVSICIALAGWCLALARLDQAGRDWVGLQRVSRAAATGAVAALAGMALQCWNAPVANRLVLLAVASWIVSVSLLLWLHGRRGAEPVQT